MQSKTMILSCVSSSISWREQVTFDEIRMMSALFWRTRVAHQNNNPRADVFPHSDTFFWFRTNQSLLFFLNAVSIYVVNKLIKDLTIGGWDPINLFNPATFLCLYEQRHTWSFQWVQLRWEVHVRFDGIDGHYCLNFIFITTEKMNFNFYEGVASSVFVRRVVLISGGLFIWYRPIEL